MAALSLAIGLGTLNPLAGADDTGGEDQENRVTSVVVLQSAPGGRGGQETGEKQEEGKKLSAAVAGHRIFFGVDFVFAGVYDGSLRDSMGRERQIKPAFVNITVGTEVTDHISFTVVVNPAKDERVPKPYEPGPAERRIYFFPNRPLGRGVVSDPSGLYKVDDYKHSGLDPILQQNILRLAYVDVHAKGRRYGATIGRNYVPQGLGIDEVVWFTAKDLTHIQMINFEADNGVFLYFDSSRVRVDLAATQGNGNPYHDYGYYDFTDPVEDKNSALGVLLSGRVKFSRGVVGASYKKDYLNSRIEDSISLMLSKHYNDAAVLFASVKPVHFLRAFGEYARYTWGLARTSAELLPGPKVVTPVYKNGYYFGVEAVAPNTPVGRWGIVFTREELSRDDSLVSWAAANELFGVTLGKKERSSIIKVQAQFGAYLTAFFFFNSLSNLFPELSAIRPIVGPDSDRLVSNTKVGLGVRFRM